MFCLKYKRQTLATFLWLLYFAVCVNLLWDLEVVAFTHAYDYKEGYLIKSLMIIQLLH